MKKLFLWSAVALSVSVLSACGGGGGGDVGASVAAPIVTAAPPVVGTPTASLTASQQTAINLSAAVNTGASAIGIVDGFGALPLGVLLSPPTAVTTTTTVACSGGGTSAETENSANPNRGTVGDSGSVVFSNCLESGRTFNGTVSLNLTRFVDNNNLTTTFSVSNFTVLQGTVMSAPSSFTGQIDLTGGAVAYSYDVNGSSVVGTAVMTRNGSTVSIANGTSRVNFAAGGFVEARYSNWVFNSATGLPDSGSATVIGAPGNTASVSVQVDGYHWLITINGFSTAYTVPF